MPCNALLATEGHDATHTALIADFHIWQAPWLMSLPQLEHDTRQLLEQQARQQARQQAFAVEKHFCLYPEILAPRGIKAALMETHTVS